MATRRVLRFALLALLGFTLFCLFVLEIVLKENGALGLGKHIPAAWGTVVLFGEATEKPVIPPSRSLLLSAVNATIVFPVRKNATQTAVAIYRNDSSAHRNSTGLKDNSTRTFISVNSSKVSRESPKVVSTIPTFSKKSDSSLELSALIDHCKNPTSKPTGVFSFKGQTMANGSRPVNCTKCFNSIFPPLIESCSVCNTVKSGRNTSLDLVMVVLTTHKATDKRQAIRQTWASITRNNTASVRHVFLLGRSKNENVMKQVHKEQAVYGDIAMYDFVDSYGNLTLKTLTALHWMVKFCDNARFLLKVDDDMWMNIPSLLKALNDKKATVETAIVGACSQSAGPIRNPRSKWYASVKSYPQKSYPGFCSGTSYATSLNVVRHVLAVSPDVPFFHLEDIYMSLCIQRLGRPFHLQRLPGFFHGYGNACVMKSKGTISVHQVGPDKLKWIWNTKCP